MTILKFKFNLTANSEEPIELPVEIRTPDLSLKRRALSYESVELEPGFYYVSAKLPSGLDLVQEIKLEGNEVTAEFNLSLDAPSPDKGQKLDPILSRQPFFRYQDKSVVSQGASEVSARIRFYEGNLLSDNCKEFSPSIDIPDYSQSVAQISLMGANRTQYLQVLQPEESAVNIALPVCSGINCLLVITRANEDKCNMDLHLQNKMADLILSYREKGYLNEVAEIATSSRFQAEELFFGKVNDPIAGAVGAYALLRSGYLTGLHDWTENVKEMFPWLPDGITIRGEHLARLGKHREALKTFAELPSRGLPIFGDGLTYAVNRLNTYMGFKRDFFEASDRARAEIALTKLQHFAIFVDFTKLTTTFFGANPIEPDTELLPKYIAPYGGLQVSKFLY